MNALFRKTQNDDVINLEITSINQDDNLKAEFNRFALPKTEPIKLAFNGDVQSEDFFSLVPEAYKDNSWSATCRIVDDLAGAVHCVINDTNFAFCGVGGGLGEGVFDGSFSSDLTQAALMLGMLRWGNSDAVVTKWRSGLFNCL